MSDLKLRPLKSGPPRKAGDPKTQAANRAWGTLRILFIESYGLTSPIHLTLSPSRQTFHGPAAYAAFRG
jgi:hypothetical protein